MPVQIGLDRARQHHAGAVVVAEHERTLDRTGGDDHAARPHAPGALDQAGACGRALGHEHQAGLAHGPGTGLRQAAHLGAGVEFGHRARHPVQRIDPADALAPPGQRAAGRHALVDQHHAAAGARGGQRRSQPRRAGADHEHVAVAVAHLVAALGRRRRRRVCQAGHAPDPGLEPVPVRPHEGLVIEGRRQQRPQPLQRREQVVPRARPAQHRAGAQAVDQPHRRRRLARAGGVVQQFDEGRRLLGTRRDDAARAVQLEAARDHAHPVGQQGRGQRVALDAGVGPAVELETQAARAVDAPAGGQPEHLSHAGPPAARPAAPHRAAPHA